VRRLRTPRVTDFSDFAARRRSAQRTSANEDPRAQEPSSLTPSGTGVLAPMRSPLQTVPPIIPPPPSSSTSSTSPTSPHPLPAVPQIYVRHGPPSPPIGGGFDTAASIVGTLRDGSAAPGSNVFYSTALSHTLTRSNSFADRRLPVPRVLHNYVPPPELLPRRTQPQNHPTDMDDFTAMFRDDFERDFGAWFGSADNADESLGARGGDVPAARTTGEQTGVAGATREMSEPAANLPTPRSISPPENS